MFTEDTEIKAIIKENPLAAYFLQKQGVDYIAYKDMPLSKACSLLNKSSEKVLRYLNLHDPNIYKKDKDFTRLSVNQLASYLKESHHEYIKEKLPFIESKLKYISGNYHQLKPLIKTFTAFKSSFLEHIYYEEDMLFPYLSELQHCHDDNDVNVVELFNATNIYSIDLFVENHSQVDEEVYQIQLRLQESLTGLIDDMHVPIILSEIDALIIDLEEHALLEDEILVNKARKLESMVHDKLTKFALLN